MIPETAIAKPPLRFLSQELSSRLQKLMFLRVIFVTLLLGTSIFIQMKFEETPFGNLQASYYLLIAGVYALTLLYILALRIARKLIWLAYLQVLLDTFLVTALIFTTGGIESPFSFLYLLAIVNASLLLYRNGGLIVATFASILYGLLLDLHFYGIIHPLGSQETWGTEYQGFQILYLISVNVVAFYLVAYLSSYLAEQVRKSRVELQAKQQDLRELQLLNQSIISSMTSGLIALDGERRIALFNPAAEKLLRVEGAAVLGRPLQEAVPLLSPHLDRLATDAGIRKAADPVRDVFLESQNNEPVHLRLSISGLKLPEGGRAGHILVLQDVTHSRRIEEEMRRMEGLALVGQLSASVAHEIRNPLASISGAIQLLKEGADEGVKERLLGIISREIDRLNHLVRDFQVFARPRRAVPADCRLDLLIQETLDLIRNNPVWNSRIEFRPLFRPPLRLVTDPEQLRQVLWNLFLNACEAMPQGGFLELQISADPSPPPRSGERVRMVIRDTGPGFEPGALKKIFLPFFTTKEEGSGLGLAIVKNIVEGLGGEIHGDNHPSGGARLTLYLPTRIPS